MRFDGATPAYRRALSWVIAINLMGFIVVLGGGLAQGSAALSANALDFLADSATYAIGLWAIRAGSRCTSARPSSPESAIKPSTHTVPNAIAMIWIIIRK